MLRARTPRINRTGAVLAFTLAGAAMLAPCTARAQHAAGRAHDEDEDDDVEPRGAMSLGTLELRAYHAPALVHPVPVPRPPRGAVNNTIFVFGTTPGPRRATVPSYGLPPGYSIDVMGRLVRTPRVPVQDTPAMIADAWGRHAALSASMGFGSPLGFIGIQAEGDLGRILGVTAGVGSGGNFGPAFAAGILVRPLEYGRWAPYVGLGWSMNWTIHRGERALTQPANSYWINGEVGIEYRGRRGFFYRAAIGYGQLLNTGDFINQEFRGWYGAQANPGPGVTPVDAADSHDQGRALGLVFMHFDLGVFLPF